jgi:hypothetical protein
MEDCACCVLCSVLRKLCILFEVIKIIDGLAGWPFILTVVPEHSSTHTLSFAAGLTFSLF